MLTSLYILACHGVCWCTGWSLLRTSQRLAGVGEAGLAKPVKGSEWRCEPDWFAAYFVGLVVQVVVCFILNQFLKLPVMGGSLLLIAFCTFVIFWVPLRTMTRPGGSANQAADPTETLHASDDPDPRGDGKTSESSSSSASPSADSLGTQYLGIRDRFTWLAAGLLAVLVAIVAARHFGHISSPLNDFDTFLYHLTLGQEMAAGSFPSQIGPSYIVEVERAYPPLFYFMYGLNMQLAPDATFLMPKLQVLGINGLIVAMVFYLARRRFRQTREASLLSGVLMFGVMNIAPNMQSITTLYLLLSIYYLWGLLDVAHEATADDSSETKPLRAARAALVWLPAAILAAGCYWANYIGLPLVGLMLMGLAVGRWIAFRGGRPSGARRFWLAVRPSVLIGIGFCALVSPHWIRNMLVVGNPIYPALPTVIGGKGLTDWYLANRWVANNMRPGFDDLPASFVAGGAMSPVVIAGVGALCTRLLDAKYRLFCLVIIAGFLVMWFRLLHLSATPYGRFLQPIAGLDAVLAGAHLVWAWRSHPLRMFAWTVFIVGLGGYTLSIVVGSSSALPHPAVMLPALLVLLLAERCCGGKDYKPTRHRWQMLYAIGAVCFVAALMAVGWNIQRLRGMILPALVAAGATALPWGYFVFIARRSQAPADHTPNGQGNDPSATARLLRSFVDDGPSRRTMAMILVAVLVVCAGRLLRFEQMNTPASGLEAPIRWMNENLPAGSVIMTAEDRLFGLRHPFQPVDDYELQAFYETESDTGSLELLRSFGVTHVFFSGKFDSRFKPFLNKTMLWPGQENAHVEVIYEDGGHRVVSVRHLQP